MSTALKGAPLTTFSPTNWFRVPRPASLGSRRTGRGLAAASRLRSGARRPALRRAGASPIRCHASPRRWRCRSLKNATGSKSAIDWSLFRVQCLVSPSIIPRQLGGPDETAPWASTSAHVSFAGPVDLDTFHIKDGVWPEPLMKTSVFVKLGSYLQPENNRPPRKGIHICHVLILFPSTSNPGSLLPGGCRPPRTPFLRGSGSRAVVDSWGS